MRTGESNPTILFLNGELLNRGHHLLDLFQSKFPIYGKRKDLACQTFSHGKAARPGVTKRLVCRSEVQWRRIMDPGFDAAFGEKSAHRVPFRRANNKQMIVMFLSRQSYGRQHWFLHCWKFCEGANVGCGVSRTRPIPIVEVAEFHREHCGLHRIETRICSDRDVLIFRRAAMIAQYAHRFGEARIVACDRSTIAICAEILSRIKAETRRPARSPNANV